MKRITAGFLALAMVLTCLAAFAASTSLRVFDQAQLMTQAEADDVQSAIEAFTQETGMDFVLLTSSEAHGGASAQEITDGFYDKYQFGADDGKRSGALLYVDMYERYVYLSTTGDMIDVMYNDRLDELIGEAQYYLGQGEYVRCVEKTLSLIKRYLREGIPEDQYRYDAFTGERLTDENRGLTVTNLLLAGVVGLAVALIFYFSVKRKYLLKGSTYRYAYQDNADVTITKATDDYLRTTTTRTRKAESSGGGRGGSGGGHGSSVHSSGGTSHGGGGGHF